jgi:SOS response regulatory protein OraA/RecX
MLKGEAEDKIRKRGSQERLQFEDHEFEECSKELGFSDEDSLEKLVLKKLRSKEIPKEPKEKFKLRDKVLRFLISKGHSFEEAKKALNQFFKNQSG